MVAACRITPRRDLHRAGLLRARLQDRRLRPTRTTRPRKAPGAPGCRSRDHASQWTATDLQVLEPKESNFLAGHLARTHRDALIGLAPTLTLPPANFAPPSSPETKPKIGFGTNCKPFSRAKSWFRSRLASLRRQARKSLDASPNGPACVEGIETRIEEWIFRSGYGERILAEQFGVNGLEGLGLAGHTQAICAAGALLHYLRETSAKTAEQSPAALLHLEPVRYYEQQDALALDPVTVRNLEIIAPLFSDESSRNSKASGPTSLLTALDETATSMGARLLRSWILRPEIDRDEIAARLDAVAELKTSTVLRGEIRRDLGAVLDLERLASRATLGVATPRDLAALRQSLARLPLLRHFLEKSAAARLKTLHDEMDELADLHEQLKTTLAEDPPALASDPGVIRRGANTELDQLRDLSQHSRQIIAAMEDRERKRTGINSLKIRYNQVFGFYIEVSNANLQLGPGRFRAQTNAGQRRALHDARAQGIRAQSAGRRRKHLRNRAPALR